MVLDAKPVLMNDEVFAEAADAPVEFEFLAAIVNFAGSAKGAAARRQGRTERTGLSGGARDTATFFARVSQKNFDDEQRIENVVLLIAEDLRVATNDAAIGVGIGSRWAM